MNKMFENVTQKELKAQYKELLRTVWADDRMVEYCSKQADVVIKFENGFYAEIEKPSIKNNFCFGYSLSSYDTESFDNASRMAEHARNSADYFREKNLAGLKEKIEYYKDKKNVLYFRNHYISQKNDIMKGIEGFNPWEEPTDSEFVQLTDKDRSLLVEAYEVELAKFTKRVDAYLKKYGTSKVKSWSYWQDA